MSRETAAHHLVPPPDWLDTRAPDDEGPSTGFLLAVTLVAAALRFIDLTGPSLWVDELLTWQVVRPGPDRIFHEQILDCIQGPLYMTVVWPLVRTLEAEWALRLPSVVAGILAVPLFGAVAGRLVPGRPARLALLVFALNPFHLWYSQEGRGYAFLILFSLAAAWVYLEMLRSGPTSGRAVLFGLAAAAAAWSNLGAIFLWVAMAATILLVDRPDRPRGWTPWVLGFGLAALLTAPWLLKASGIWAVDRILPGATGAALRGETTFDLMAIPYTLQAFFYGFSLGPSTAELHQPDRMAVVRSALPLLAVAALPVGLGLLASVRRPNRSFWRLLLWAAVPLLILAVLSVRNIKPWNPRYVAMALPWFLILVSVGLTHLPRRVGLALTLVLTAMTLWSVGNHFGDGRYAKADLRRAVVAVEEANADADPILVPVVTAVFDFYHRGGGRTIGTYGLPPLGGAEEADRFVAARLGDTNACWYVAARSWYFDPGGHLPVALARAGHLRRTGGFDGVEIYRWERSASDGENHGP